ncbi:acyl-CoA dehydrogenase [Bradyrhizobium sp. AUGA SZCCT0240]|uniref:acyl-CoA dehydrogenase family protein n=1 Tax=Bradyrhizobium sp. AUGA SZCCT0240 TaxID=2807669 RepID=UPI001BAC408D|nr:acyl-CoA dehydrogenase [Bradyrhizobium sp. AUGA SZCCT0240]MBR1252321.1 acyl-CoA dehydrogenase [Bradyrhizobium sp. AUGA SZCCT0240]
MITFELTEEQQIAQSTMREFAQNVLRPIAQKADSEGKVGSDALDAIWSTEIVQAQAAEEGRSPVLNAILLEELAAADATIALAVAAPMGFVQAVIDQGSSWQRETILKEFAGRSYKAAAITIMEPSFDADVSRLRTRASKSGDDYVIDGKKAFVPLASECTHFLVVAESGGSADAFIVPRESKGVRVEAPRGTLGLCALGMSEVHFEGVRVPASMRLGEHNGCDVQKIVDAARVGLSAIATGLGRSVLDYVIPYTKDRVVHGTALARKQAIAFRIADMHIEVEAMRWMSWYAAWQLETSQNATRSAQLAYSYAAEQVLSIADEGVQAFGGHGFVRAHPIEMWYRNARSLSVLEGIAGV